MKSAKIRRFKAGSDLSLYPMKFHETLQALRKQKGWTQEELAQKLYVSRTAVSKWESGRGYPNIDSLKAVAACFSVSVDALLTGGEVLTIAQKVQKQKNDLVFGLLDLSAALLFFLPCFRQTVDGKLQEVSLLVLTAVAPYMRFLYWDAVCSVLLAGVHWLSDIVGGLLFSGGLVTLYRKISQ